MNSTQRVLADVKRHGPTTAASVVMRLGGSIKRATVVRTLLHLAKSRAIAARCTEGGIRVYASQDNRPLPPPPMPYQHPAATSAWDQWFRSPI